MEKVGGVEIMVEMMATALKEGESQEEVKYFLMDHPNAAKIRNIYITNANKCTNVQKYRNKKTQIYGWNQLNDHTNTSTKKWFNIKTIYPNMY